MARAATEPWTRRCCRSNDRWQTLEWMRRGGPVPGRMMLRMQAMTASGSGIDGMARCRGPCFCSDQTTACCCCWWAELTDWRVLVTGGSRICTLTCDLLDRPPPPVAFVARSSPSLATSSLRSTDVTAAAAAARSSASTGVGRASSTDITESCAPQRPPPRTCNQ